MSKTKVSKRKWLIIPIETKARELYGKLLLSCYAAESGLGVIIGGKKATRGEQDKLPKGTFLEKSIPPGNSSGVVNNILSFNNKVSAVDEEGLVYMNKEHYFNRRINPDSFRKVDHFFTWGKKQADDIASLIESPEGKIVNSGNPRFDLLRPEFRDIYEKSAQQLKDKYGKIILINTSFWIFNNAGVGSDNRIKNAKNSGQIKSKAQEEEWLRMSTLQEKVFHLMLDLLPNLSKEFPDHSIIIRPHPSENNQPWIDKCKDLPNVNMVHEKSANDWIMASDVVIENNCTTSIEAFLLEKAAITYRPEKDEEVEMKLPNGLGFHADNEIDLMDLMKKIINGEVKKPHDYEDQVSFVKEYIANVDGALASEVITDTINRIELPVVGGEFPIKHKDSLKRFLRKIKNSIVPGEAEVYYRKKFPGIKLQEVEDIVEGFRELSGKFSELKIIKITDDGFCIYK
ncbi:MAG: surface carbohydrate biosynthesis protein [Candidatus Paceibacteria bacterium]|jgi:surface carbohydrate biosynthesis protein